jgi:hypothetical protein
MSDLPKRRGRKKKYETTITEKNKITGFIKSTNTSKRAIDPVSSSPASSSSQIEKIRFGKGLVIQKHESQQEITKQNNTIKSFIHATNSKNSSFMGKNVTEIGFSAGRCNINLDFLNANNSTDQTNVQAFLEPKPSVLSTASKPKQTNVTIMLQHGRDAKKWPATTDIWCWWCCYPFDTMPCFIPTRYDSLRGRFKITGNFCSWNCAKSYLCFGQLGSRRKDMHMFTSLMFHLKLPVNIKLAPSKEVLQRFGGTITIEEFRSSFHNRKLYHIKQDLELDDTYNIYEY